VTRAAIQLPPLSPSAPVRTQVFQPGRPDGRWLAAAYGPRVEGPDPVDNAGERRIPRGGSPQESGFRCGQRPSVHRLQRCRRPKGPRASGATATPTPGPKPRRGTPRQQRITHGGWCRAQGAHTPDPGRGSIRQGRLPLLPGTRRTHSSDRCGGETCVSPLHIPSDHCRRDATRAIVPCPDCN
jgi:hypothetical protein